jgi:ABC-type amino acid transport substrate-binding protein
MNELPGWLPRALLALAAALACQFAAAEARDLDEVRERGVLRVAFYEDFPPYSANGGGIDVDIAAALADRLGVRLAPMWFRASDESVEDDLRNMVWRGHYLGTGPADALIHAPIDPALAARSPRVRFVAPYSRERLVIARSLQRVPLLDDLSALEGLPVGVEDASLASITMLSEAGGRYRADVRHFKTPVAAVAALKKGELAALVAQWGEAHGLVGADPDFAITPLPVAAGFGTRQWVLGIAIPKAHGRLGDALEQAMSALAADGELDRIFARHGVTRLQP